MSSMLPVFESSSEAQGSLLSPGSTPTVVIVAAAARRPRGIAAWLAHIERQRRRRAVLNQIRGMLF